MGPLMYRNSHYIYLSLFKDDVAEVTAELGEYAYIHLTVFTDRLTKSDWGRRERFFKLALIKLKRMGYKRVFCLIPLTNPLAKEVRGRSRAERMLNFRRIHKSKEYLYLYKDV